MLLRRVPTLEGSYATAVKVQEASRAVAWAKVGLWLAAEVDRRVSHFRLDLGQGRWTEACDTEKPERPAVALVITPVELEAWSRPLRAVPDEFKRRIEQAVYRWRVAQFGTEPRAANPFNHLYGPQ